MTTQAITIKPASLGTISHGTLRTEDQLNAFGDELEWQIRRNGEFFSQPENFATRDFLNNLHGEHCDIFDADGNLPDDKEEEASTLVMELAGILSEHFAPRYCYFGTHEGDGSDFGYWADWSRIEELPVVEGSDEALALSEDCKSVNDHGNVTVYGADGSVILELV